MPYRAGFHLRNRHRTRARRHAAGVIGRAFRKRRAARGRKQRYNRTKNTITTSLGKRGKKRTLTKRVAALETGSKKHHDQISNTVELLGAIGTDLNTSKISYSTLLAIQGPKCDATAGNAALDESEQRMNDVVYAKSVRIRGVLTGTRPQDLATPVSQTMNEFGCEKMKTLCATRMWISILLDKRPSQVDGEGKSQVNPLPTTAGETCLESVYQATGTAAGSPSMLTLWGPENALRSYNSSRFKIVHQECITTSMTNPRKYFDIKYKINKKLKYVEARYGVPAPANPPQVPYNYNLLVVFTCNSPAVPILWATELSPPMLNLKSSRLYFTDS